MRARPAGGIAFPRFNSRAFSRIVGCSNDIGLQEKEARVKRKCGKTRPKLARVMTIALSSEEGNEGTHCFYHNTILVACTVECFYGFC